MKKTELFLVGLFAILTTAIFASCSKSSDSGSKTPSASIKDTSQTVNENVGTASVIVNLSAATSQALKLNFTITGTAILNGDYEMDSTASITIPAGSSSGTLNFRIFDDPVPEPSKTIHVKFTSSGNVTFATSEATITIQDNDVSRASTGLEADMLWDAGSLVDLDLYAVNNVVIDSTGQVTSLNLVDSSEAAKGFESVLIKNTGPDGPYYYVVSYATGNRTVIFSLNLNGPGGLNATRKDTLTAADAGYAFLYGPITKAGSNYTFRQSRPIFDLQKVRRFLYPGKLK
jgi:hypothetical protein